MKDAYFKSYVEFLGTHTVSLGKINEKIGTITHK